VREVQDAIEKLLESGNVTTSTNSSTTLPTVTA
jgi:hypothetical protein